MNKVAGNLIEKNHLRYSSSYISNVGIWNRKTDRLEPSDITGDKILISCDGKIYDAYILFESNKLNKFSIQVSEDRRQVELDFSYIEKNDTIIISIIHDSWSSIFSEKKITVSAPVKSAGNSKKVTYNEKSIDMDSNVFGFSKIFAFVYAAGAIYFLILTLTVEGIIWRGLSLLMLFLFIRWLIESVSELRGLPFGNREFKNNI